MWTRWISPAVLALFLCPILPAAEITSAAAAPADGPIYWAEPRRQEGGDYRWVVSAASGVIGLSGQFRKGGAYTYRPMGAFTKEGELWTAPLAAEEFGVRGLEFFIESQGVAGSYGSAEAPIQYRTRATVEAPAATPLEHRMISAPMLVEGGDNVLERLRPYLGEPGRTSWMMWRWDPSEAVYTEVTVASPAAFESGHGYWIALAGQQAWSLTGTAVFPQSGTGGFFEFPLQPGWNMVGNPAGYGISIGGFQIRDGAQTLTFSQAATRNLVDREIWTFNGAGYVRAASVLGSWSACWVHNRTGRELGLLLPGNQANSSLVSGAPDPGPPDPDQPVDCIVLHARSGEETAEAVLAVSPLASLGVDSQDAYAPPGFPGASLRLTCERVMEPSPDGHPAELCRDVIGSEVTGGARWTLSVQAASPVELSWTPLGSLLERDRLILAQESSGPEPPLDMTRVQSLLLPAGQYRFRVSSSERSPVDPPDPETGAFWCRVQPNPAAGHAILRFGVVQECEIRLAVVDAGGRSVWHSSWDAISPGEHWVGWVACDPHGRKLAAGGYYLTGVARTPRGRALLRSVHFVLLR